MAFFGVSNFFLNFETLPLNYTHLFPVAFSFPALYTSPLRFLLPPCRCHLRRHRPDLRDWLPSLGYLLLLMSELLHIHSSLHLILLILRGPLDSITPSIVGTITCPRLRATLRALETSIEQIRRSTCTTLFYTDELCSTLGLGTSTSYWPFDLLSYIPFFTSAPSAPLSVSSFSTWDDDDDYDHGSLSSSRSSFFSDSFSSTFDLDEEAKFSLTLSFTFSSSTLPTLADFSPIEPFSAAKVLLALCFLFSVLD